MWVYNYDGEVGMKGWVYQQGDWSWGSVLTWYVTDLGDPWFTQYGWGHEYVWLCYLWVWSLEHGWLYKKINVPLMDVDPMDVYWNPWMEHCIAKFQ